MNKRDMSRFVKKQLAGLIGAMDLDELLGTEVYEQNCDNLDLMEHAEKVRDAVARNVERM